jgi:hypothetical protein
MGARLGVVSSGAGCAFEAVRPSTTLCSATPGSTASPKDTALSERRNPPLCYGQAIYETHQTVTARILIIVFVGSLERMDEAVALSQPLSYVSSYRTYLTFLKWPRGVTGFYLKEQKSSARFC